VSPLFVTLCKGANSLTHSPSTQRSEKKARPRLTLGIRLILTFLIRLNV
jgi:hypothetical protein